MTSASETFDAYRPDGTPVEIVVRNIWEPERVGLRQEREAFCLRHGFFVLTDSCAVACIMAAFNAGRE
jgi:hypothetical protein